MIAAGSSGRSKRRRWVFLPPMLIVGVSLGLFAYRMNASDWYWGPVPVRKAGPTLARVEPPVQADVPETAAVEPDAPPGPDVEQPPDAVAQAEPVDPEESIRREAEQARVHRDEIAKLKEREADRLDRNPPRPDPRFGGFNPAALAAIQRQRQAMMRQMEAMMEDQVRQFEGMFPGRRVPGGRFMPPLPWGGPAPGDRDLPMPGFLPNLPAEVQAEMDRMFEGTFRVPARPGLRRAPANPFPVPPPGPRRPQPPRDPSPAGEFDSRSFT